MEPSFQMRLSYERMSVAEKQEYAFNGWEARVCLSRAPRSMSWLCIKQDVSAHVRASKWARTRHVMDKGRLDYGCQWMAPEVHYLRSIRVQKAAILHIESSRLRYSLARFILFESAFWYKGVCPDQDSTLVRHVSVIPLQAENANRIITISLLSQLNYLGKCDMIVLNG